VWNGSEWSRVQVVQTGREQRLIRVVCTGGYDLICTEYHKFVLADGTLCDAKDLSVAQELLFAPQPVVEGSEEMDVESPFLRGFYKTMDDCVLLTRSSVACRVEWINGYCSQAMAPRTHDGWLRLATETGHLELRALLNSLGVFAIEAEGLICVDTAGQRQLESLGVEVGFSEDLPLCEVSPLIVVAKEDPGFYGDTFCFREPKLQRGMFNGILTGNCTEILEYTDNEQTAVCNLASIALNKMVTLERAFDFDKLERATRLLVRNLNRIIDINVYPVYEGERSNKLHRPMGIGVQGLADAFALMKIAFESDEARKLNKDIFETMYYAALSESCALAEREGPYASFEGSPAS
jgi:ribonucleotide reductase alpha subunit